MRTSSRKQTLGRRGFSLVELTIVVLLLGLVLGSVALVAGSSDRMYRTESVHSLLEAQVGMAMQHVTEDLRSAAIDTLAPPPQEGVGSSSVQYVQATGIVGDQIQWSPLRRLELELEMGELDDGLDNNHNGLVDERRLVLIEDPGGPSERRRVLTRWVSERLEGEVENGLDDNGNGLVDEPGFVLELEGESVTIRLTLERMTPEGALLRRTAVSSVHPRNILGGGS